jgi:DNA polymerase-3 subunit beta
LKTGAKLKSSEITKIMEAIINSKKLKEQVGALQGILARKNTIPVLSKIKIDASERGDLIMTATDLDISLIIEQETDVLRPGSICLSGKKLGDITATFPNEPIHLRLDDKGEKVEFRAGRFVSPSRRNRKRAIPGSSARRGRSRQTARQ